MFTIVGFQRKNYSWRLRHCLQDTRKRNTWVDFYFHIYANRFLNVKTYSWYYVLRLQKVRWKNQWSQPEHVLAKRLLLFPEQCNSNSHGHDPCRYEWLVKWTELGYDQATWELENAPFLRTPEGIKLINDFAIRHEKVKVESHNAKETKVFYNIVPE